jgi:hypothetical protein
MLPKLKLTKEILLYRSNALKAPMRIINWIQLRDFRILLPLLALLEKVYPAEIISKHERQCLFC